MTYEDYRRKKKYYYDKFQLVLEPEDFFCQHNHLESNEHKDMKNCARILLEHFGFHVELEYPFGDYRLDVYATRGKDVIVVECGWCTQEKIDELRKHFKKVIHVPYVDCGQPM